MIGRTTVKIISLAENKVITTVLVDSVSFTKDETIHIRFPDTQQRTSIFQKYVPSPQMFSMRIVHVEHSMVVYTTERSSYHVHVYVDQIAERDYIRKNTIFSSDF